LTPIYYFFILLFKSVIFGWDVTPNITLHKTRITNRIKIEQYTKNKED